MNKSKFLKKSLAMLLALMLVFAMIPLSASADETGDYVKDLYVNGKRAALVGNELSVDIPTTEYIDITAAAINGATLYAKIGDQEVLLPALSKEVADLTADGEDTYTVDILAKKKLTPESSDYETVATYTLTITLVQPDPDSNDKQLRGLTAGATEWKHMSTYEVDHEEETVTITMKFGYDKPALDGDEFQPMDPEADVEIVTDSDGNEAVQVTSVQGSYKQYTVIFQWEPAFESFTIPNQVGETEFVYNGRFGNEININVPYGYDLENIIPTFELVEGIADFFVLEPAREDLVSNFTVLKGMDVDGAVGTINLWSDTTEPAQVILTVTAVAKNPEGVLKTITVTDSGTTVKSNETNATEGTTYVQMPANTQIRGNVFDLTMTASAGATVKVTDAKGQNIEVNTTTVDGVVYYNANGAAGSEVTEGEGISFTVQVTSEDGSVTNNYHIVLQVPDKALAKLTNVTLKDTVTNETYSVDIPEGQYDVELTVPYAWTNPDNTDNVVVFMTASTGATIQHGKTGATWQYNNDKNWGYKELSSASSGWMPAIDDAEGMTYKVSNSTWDDSNVYTLKIKSETSLKDREIESIQFVGTDKPYEITPSNTYETKLGTATLKSTGATVDTIEVTLPYSWQELGISDAWLQELKLSDGAVAYYAEKSYEDYNNGVITAMGDTSVTNKPYTFEDITNYLGLVDKNGVLDDTKNYMRVIVLSEENAVPEGNKIGDVSDYKDNDNASIYYLVAKKAPAETGDQLLSIESTLDKNVTATLNGDTVTITVPNTYKGSFGDADAADKMFTLNFEQSKLATVTDNNKRELESDLGSAEVNDATKFIVDPNGDLYNADHQGDDAITQFIVTAENERNTQAYDVKVVVNKPETGAEITGLSVNGTAATIARNVISVRLPLGSKLYPVTLDIEASKMATVWVDGDKYDPKAANDRFDVNDDVTIKVTSENKATTNTYTLKVVVSDSFNDVPTSEWYYDEVMTAANAGWINGTKPGYFEPNGTMTRGDFMVIIARILDCDTEATVESKFPDCNETDYFNAAVTFCKLRGIIDGDDKGYFNPYAAITREEMAKILCNALELDELETSANPFDDDAEIAQWAKGYVNAVQAEGIMEGSNGSFNPRDNATRAEGAAVLVRAFA